MPDPSSYTFKLTDRAATNIYTPYGDGPPNSGWRILRDSHNTMAANASLRITWVGTAITVNGFVNSSHGPPAYMLSLDGEQLVQETLDNGKVASEILLSKSALPHGNHTIVMSNLAGGNLSVQGIQLDIDTGNNRTTWTDRTLGATINSNGLWSPNPFFTFDGDWFPAQQSSAPSMLTTADNTSSILSFNLTDCSSFFLYGPMPYNSGTVYNVKLTPPVHPDDFPVQTFNSTLGPGVDDPYPSTEDEVLFWQSGMDRNMNYTVNVNVTAGGQWGFSKLVVYDATDLAPGSSSSGKVSAGMVVLIILLLFAFFGGGTKVVYVKKKRSC